MELSFSVMELTTSWKLKLFNHGVYAQFVIDTSSSMLSNKMLLRLFQDPNSIALVTLDFC